MRKNRYKKLLILMIMVLFAVILLITVNHKEPVVVKNLYEIAPSCTDNLNEWGKEFNRQDIELALNHIEYLKGNLFNSPDIYSFLDIIKRGYRHLLRADEILLASGEYELAELWVMSVRVAIGEREYWAPYRVSVTGVTSKDGTKMYSH